MSKTAKAVLGGEVLFVLFTLNPQAAAQEPCVPPPSGLVSWWPGDGNASDIQGSNSGTLQGGATFGAGKVGQAFSFDGVDDAVRVPDADSLDITADFTIELWMNPRSYQVGRVIGKHTAGVDNDGSWSWFFHHDIPQSLNFQVRPGPDIVGANVPIPLNEWTHVALTFDDANKQFAIYFNGMQVGQGTADLNINNTTRDLYIGSEEDRTFFDGLLDEVALYNRALSAAEISAIANAGSAGKCKAAQPVVVNDLVTLFPVGTVFDPTPVDGGPAGTFTITATFTNTSSTPIHHPVFGVTQLSGGGPSQTLFVDDFGGPNLNPIWQPALPDALTRFSDGIATYLGESSFSFQSLDGSSVIRLQNTLNNAQRRGWSSSTNFTSDAPIVYEARFNTVVQSPSTGIDELLEIWLLDSNNLARYDKVALSAPEFGSGRVFTADSTITNVGLDTHFPFTNNTWYRMVIRGSMTQEVRASIYNDARTVELIGVNLGHNLTAYTSGFKIGISQSMGGPGSPFPTDVALDSVRLTAQLGNLLLNADGGPEGVGAFLTPDVGPDAILSPGESFTTAFVIGLQARKRFTFLVDLLGVPGP